MKIYTLYSITSLNSWMRFLRVMFTVVLMLPVVAVSQSSPTPVDLGTSGDFVILSETGITSTGVTSITGDIGVSPIDHTAITGFDLILAPSGTYSTSILVAGNVYAADYADPTPTKLLTAIGDMGTAYIDAAGRTLPDYTELYDGDLTGQTLTHGLYKWGTGVQVSAGGVTISGTSSDVWIFQIAQDLILSDGAIVSLTGGAQSSNIFWQVAGQVTLGTMSEFKGILLCQTLIAMQTGATFDGRALAQTAVTLQANEVIINIVVPVELTSFSATTEKNDVNLVWNTATETNNQGFEIQRMNINDTKYEKVGYVEGNGTTTKINRYNFDDKDVLAGNYNYRLKQIDFNGTFEYSGEIEVNITSPSEFSISQNYPNPFIPTSTIQYAIPQTSFVKISIYNILGNEIEVLVNEEKSPGDYEVIFDATELASGMYFYKLSTGKFSQTRKMVVMK